MPLTLQTTQQMEMNFKLKSQTQKILDYMLEGNRINTWIAYEKFHCTCLAQRIFDIRKKMKEAAEYIGATIMVLRDETVNRNGKHFTEYWIEKRNA